MLQPRTHRTLTRVCPWNSGSVPANSCSQWRYGRQEWQESSVPGRVPLQVNISGRGEDSNRRQDQGPGKTKVGGEKCAQRPQDSQKVETTQMSINSEWLNAMHSAHTMERYSAMKRNKALTQATTGTETLHWAKEAIHKRPRVVWFHLYEMQTGGCSGWGGQSVLRGTEFLLRRWKCSKNDRGGGCAAPWVY